MAEERGGIGGERVDILLSLEGKGELGSSYLILGLKKGSLAADPLV